MLDEVKGQASVISRNDTEAKPGSRYLSRCSRGPSNQCFHRSVAMETGQRAQLHRDHVSELASHAPVSSVPVINKCKLTSRSVEQRLLSVNKLCKCLDELFFFA